MEVLLLSPLKGCFDILTAPQTVKCWAINAEGHPERSHSMAVLLILMLTWKGDWKFPCGGLSHKDGLLAGPVQPPLPPPPPPQPNTHSNKD